MKSAYQKGPIASDTEIGGDADAPGIAKPITYDDIQAIVISDAPVEMRRRELNDLLARLESGEHIDLGNDMEALADTIRQALSELNRSTGAGKPAALPGEERLDAKAPDEDLESLDKSRKD